MLDINTTINTCYLEPEVISLAYYSHLIPIVLSLLLAVLIVFKAKFNLFSKIFLSFVVSFCLWLLGDFITWTSDSYNLIYAAWAPLVYLEIVFFTLGLYFAIVFERKADIPNWNKVLLFLLTLPPFILTVIGQSVTGFNHSFCEVFNNTSLDIYKLSYELVVLAVILVYAINPFFRKFSWKSIKPNLAVLGSMFLFLAIFGATEYLASVTGDYEMNLYSLFLLPLFLIAIIYSVFELDVFNVHVLGTHYLVIGLVILMCGQLFFITDSTNRLLTIIAIIIAIILSYILFRNLKKESDQRVQIIKLNTDLKELLTQRESLVHLVTHKVKGSFTRSKYIFASILDGTFGDVSDEVKKWAGQGLESDNTGIQTVDLVLNASNLQKGNVKYDMKQIDFKEIVLKVVNDKRGPIESKGLKLETDIKDGVYTVLGDPMWLKEVVHNFIENSTRYTKAGTVTVGLERFGDKVRFSVKDTGVGITAEDKVNLFTEGGRGKDSVKTNVDSTGYGLYSVKLIMDAHGGKVWGESEGEGKGSTFYAELNAVV